jgi:predicted MPP superfamily phosphohydrolase
LWFIFLGVGLILLVISGLYARARLAAALVQLGAGTRAARIVRWATAWLLFAYPLGVFGAVLVSLARGAATVPRLDGQVASWLLGLPFIWALLVVLQALPWLVANDLGSLIVRRWRGPPAAARVRAVATLAILGGFAIYTPVRILVERGDVALREHRVGTATPGTPPLRIAFLADIQQDVHTDGDRARELYARVNDRHPDLVLSGGDWINTGPDYIESAAAAAGTLHSRLGTFSVRGDHEHFAYRDRERSAREITAAMAAHGVVMLDNEVRWFDHGGKRIAVLFLNYNYIHRTPTATVATLVASLAHADYAIVVTHQLDTSLAAVLQDKVDLVLAGHTHGGQVNPVVGVVHVPLARLETPFVNGRYQLGRTTVIVTAGVGYSVVPIRYAAPSSIELIDLAL